MTGIIRPLTHAFTGGAYTKVRRWCVCPKCWHARDIDISVKITNQPLHCANSQCQSEWGEPITIEELAEKVNEPCVIYHPERRDVINFGAYGHCSSCLYQFAGDISVLQDVVEGLGCPECHTKWSGGINLRELTSEFGVE
jgi:hypothetical protein